MLSKSDLKDIMDYFALRIRRARESWASLNKVQRFIRMSQVAALISLIFALKWHIFYGTSNSTWNPFSMLVYMFQTSFPLIPFLVAFSILEVPVLIFTLYRDQFGIPDPNREFEISKNGTYGTAEQLTEMQLREWGGAEILPVEDTTGPIFGMIDDEAEKVVSFNLHDKAAMMNRHILVFGASMSGKTFSFVLPHLLQICKRGESVVMSDPKGELFTKTSEYFKSYGYIVRVLNFNEFQYSDGWDILAELGDPSDVAKVQERAQIFAETVIANTMANTEDMFRSAPLSLLKAIMLRVYLDPSLPHTFETVFEIISNPGGKDFFDQLFDENRLTGDLKCCLGPYSTYRQQSANLAGNTLSGLANAIQIFQTERIRKLTSTKGIDLTLPGKRKCAYYLIFPDQHETYKFLTSLLFSFLFIDLVAYADATPEHHCAVHVNCLFEEAKSVGFIPGFATKLSNIRSRWIYITSIWQDLAQVQFLYPDEWGSILNNSSTQLCLGFNDLDTAKLFSDRSGGATIIVDTQRHGAFETELNLFHPHNVGEGTRMVFTPDELMRAGKNECFIIFQRMNMMKCKKFPVTLHPDYDRMEAHPVLPQDVIPSIDDDKARAAYEEELVRNADEYQTWINAGNVEQHGRGKDAPPRRNAYDIDIESDNLASIIAKKAMKWSIEKSSEHLPTSDELGKEGEDWDWEIDFDATVQSKEEDRSAQTRHERLLNDIGGTSEPSESNPSSVSSPKAKPKQSSASKPKATQTRKNTSKPSSEHRVQSESAKPVKVDHQPDDDVYEPGIISEIEPDDAPDFDSDADFFDDGDDLDMYSDNNSNLSEEAEHTAGTVQAEPESQYGKQNERGQKSEMTPPARQKKASDSKKLPNTSKPKSKPTPIDKKPQPAGKGTPSTGPVKSDKKEQSTPDSTANIMSAMKAQGFGGRKPAAGTQKAKQEKGPSKQNSTQTAQKKTPAIKPASVPNAKSDATGAKTDVETKQQQPEAAESNQTNNSVGGLFGITHESRKETAPKGKHRNHKCEVKNAYDSVSITDNSDQNIL